MLVTYLKKLLRPSYRFVINQRSKRKLLAKAQQQKAAFVQSLHELGLQQTWNCATDFLLLEDALHFTPFDRHYVYHPAWAYRILVNHIRPSKHIDISSSLHFCTMVSATIPTDFYDYRPAALQLSQLNCQRGDLMQLPFATQSVESISCLHTVEHIGLGRYGDPIDAAGDIKAMQELQRVVAKGGSLLFVVPIGIQNNIHFNAHRVYTPEWVVQSFPELTLQEFYYIQSNPDLHPVVTAASTLHLGNEQYGCGCFWFKRDA